MKSFLLLISSFINTDFYSCIPMLNYAISPTNKRSCLSLNDIKAPKQPECVYSEKLRIDLMYDIEAMNTLQVQIEKYRDALKQVASGVLNQVYASLY